MVLMKHNVSCVNKLVIMAFVWMPVLMGGTLIEPTAMIVNVLKIMLVKIVQVFIVIKIITFSLSVLDKCSILPECDLSHCESGLLRDQTSCTCKCK